MVSDERSVITSAPDAAAAARADDKSPFAADLNAAAAGFDLSRHEAGSAEPRVSLNLRVDRDILEFFRGGGPGHRQRIHAVLRAHVDGMKKL